MNQRAPTLLNQIMKTDTELAQIVIAKLRRGNFDPGLSDRDLVTQARAVVPSESAVILGMVVLYGFALEAIPANHGFIVIALCVVGGCGVYYSWKLRRNLSRVQGIFLAAAPTSIEDALKISPK